MDSLPRLLITAGPTHEPLDQVRYLGNRSSGRMGLALAEAAAARGLPTTLLLGPLEAERFHVHSHLSIERFQTAADLERLLADQWPYHDILFMAAAVADYREYLKLRPDAHDSRAVAERIAELEPVAARLN